MANSGAYNLTRTAAGDSVGDKGLLVVRSPSETPPTSDRGGVTLIELLLVIAILMMLLAVAVPAIQPGMETRRIREAGRSIDVECGSARNRAMETGRPCGIMIRRAVKEELPECAMVLEQAEVPPSYGGETLNSRARLQVTDLQPGGTATVTARLDPSINAELVSPGDLVQFNYQGPLYTVIGAAGDSLQLVIDVSQGQMLPWPLASDSIPFSAPVPYEIFRRPMKSFTTPVQLPAGAVIDLQFSGCHDHFIGAGTGTPVYIMFSPNGSLDRVYHDGHVHAATEPVYLLVGKQERIPAPDPPDPTEPANWQDPTNLWVSLNPQTGLVTTNHVAVVDPAITDPEVGVPLSREFAREGQSMGGR